MLYAICAVLDFACFTLVDGKWQKILYLIASILFMITAIEQLRK